MTSTEHSLCGRCGGHYVLSLDTENVPCAHCQQCFEALTIAEYEDRVRTPLGLDLIYILENWTAEPMRAPYVSLRVTQDHSATDPMLAYVAHAQPRIDNDPPTTAPGPTAIVALDRLLHVLLRQGVRILRIQTAAAV